MELRRDARAYLAVGLVHCAVATVGAILIAWASTLPTGGILAGTESLPYYPGGFVLLSGAALALPMLLLAGDSYRRARAVEAPPAAQVAVLPLLTQSGLRGAGFTLTGRF